MPPIPSFAIGSYVRNKRTNAIARIVPSKIHEYKSCVRLWIITGKDHGRYGHVHRHLLSERWEPLLTNKAYAKLLKAFDRD